MQKNTFENSLCYCLLLISMVAGYTLGVKGETSTLDLKHTGKYRAICFYIDGSQE